MDNPFADIVGCNTNRETGDNWQGYCQVQINVAVNINVYIGCKVGVNVCITATYGKHLKENRY